VVNLTLLAQAGIAAPFIGYDQRSRHDGTPDKSGQRCGAAVVSDGQLDTTGIATIFALVMGRAWLPATNPDDGRYQRLVVNTSAFTACAASNSGVVHLNKITGPATNPILIGPHHPRTEFMQNAEGSFISRQSKLSLKLHRRHARRLAGNQIRSPEPWAQKRMAARHDRAYGQSRLAATSMTCQHAGPHEDVEW